VSCLEIIFSYDLVLYSFIQIPSLISDLVQSIIQIITVRISCLVLFIFYHFYMVSERKALDCV
jgi:hypothetical protein